MLDLDTLLEDVKTKAASRDAAKDVRAQREDALTLANSEAEAARAAVTDANKALNDSVKALTAAATALLE